tara:strand:- start:505 stop:1080 length:576 start_codon:yes stop_codon:yes gene_type:complete
MKKIFFGLFFIFLLIKSVSSNEIIVKIEENWNQIRSMSGEFLQLDPDGNVSSGKFYFLKPFQSKFHYDNKEEIIITNQSLLRIVDQEGYQIDSYPIGNNILKKLLSEKVSLTMDFDIISIEEENNAYEVTLKLKGEKVENPLLFLFDKESLNLKKWEIYDEFSNKTVLEFTKIKKNIFISQNLFVVKYKDN